MRFMKMRESIKRVFWLYVVLFFAAFIYLLYYVMVNGNDVAAESMNPHMMKTYENIKRGDILDCGGRVLAGTEDGVRMYYDGGLFCHTVGFERNGIFDTKCVESEYFFPLHRLHNEMYQRARNIFNPEIPLQGDSIVLTIDRDIQELAYELLESTGLNGGIVALEPSTGKVLAMVSSPSYTLESIPDILSKEKEPEGVDGAERDSPLINRATQGLYPPGSVFKVITAASAMENMENLNTFTYECRGVDSLDGVMLRCFDEKAHGTVDMKKAMAVSCNLYFAKLGEILGAEKIRETSEKFYFNQTGFYEFPLVTSQNECLRDINVKNEKLIKTAIGQGDTLVTPLHMAMVYSSVASGGIMMAPYIVDHDITYSGAVINKRMPKMIAQIGEPAEMGELTDILTEAVEGGTGVRAKIDGIAVAGKTGTAQITSTDSGADNKKFKDHAWFIGFAPADNPVVTVAVILENGGNGSDAAPIAKEIIKAVLESRPL